MATEQPSESESPLKFEEALARLEGIVRALEDGEIGLDDALAQYEQGVKLLRQCHDLLQHAERRIELLSGLDADGNPVCTPFDDQNLTLEEKADRRTRRRSAVGKSRSSNGGENGVDEPCDLS